MNEGQRNDEEGDKLVMETKLGILCICYITNSSWRELQKKKYQFKRLGTRFDGCESCL